MTLLTKALLAVIAALALTVGVQTWRVKAHQNDAVEAAVAPAKEQAVIAAAKVETVTVTLAAKRDTLLRVLHDTVTVPERALHPTTAADTASAVAALPIVTAERDSIARGCHAYVMTCDEFRAAAQQRFHADSSVIAKQDALLKVRPKSRRFSLGITVGYGATAFRDRSDSIPSWHIVSGPSATVGGSLRIY